MLDRHSIVVHPRLDVVATVAWDIVYATHASPGVAVNRWLLHAGTAATTTAVAAAAAAGAAGCQSCVAEHANCCGQHLPRAQASQAAAQHALQP